MTQFKYDTLDDMGDLTEFAAELGTWPSGQFPRFSGTRTENSTWDAMLASDAKRYPERWAEEAVTHPAPPLRDGLLGIIIRFWYEARRHFAIWTDREVLRRFTREQLVKHWAKLGKYYRKVLVKLGEPTSSTVYRLRKVDSMSDILGQNYVETEVNPQLAQSLDRAVAQEKALRARKIGKDDPCNDSTLFS